MIAISILSAVIPLALPRHSWHRRHRVNSKFGTLVKYMRDTRVRTMCAYAARYGRRARSSAVRSTNSINPHDYVVLYVTQVCSVISSLYWQDRAIYWFYRQRSENVLIQLKWNMIWENVHWIFNVCVFVCIIQ